MRKMQRERELAKRLSDWDREHPEKEAGPMANPNPNEFGMDVQRLYTPANLANDHFDYQQDLGLPGEFPFTRGIDPDGYRTEPWYARQYVGYSSSAETNQLFKGMVARSGGKAALSLALDLPTQLGLDPDHPQARGEVGRTGITLKSLRDWERIFEGIDMNHVYVNTVTNAQAAVVMAMQMAYAQQQGIPLSQVKGSVQNDILKEYIARGNFIFPVEPAMRLWADMVEFSLREAPNYSPASVCEIHIAEAGANKVHQVAITLGIAIDYFDAMARRGVDVGKFASKTIYNSVIYHTDLFAEVAKLRTVRRMWAKILRDRYGIVEPQACKLVMASHQGGVDLTRERPLNNITRSALACLAGALAGAQYINLRTMDEVYGIPTEEASLIALDTQHVIAHETNVRATIDPLAGSYYVESLSSEIERKATAELDRIGAMGGLTKGIESGYVQRMIWKDAIDRQRVIENGTRVMVGHNKFKDDRQAKIKGGHRADPHQEERQLAELKELKRSRDNARVAAALKLLDDAARDQGPQAPNMMVPIMEAVKAYATTGEICGVLRGVFGEYRESFRV